MRSTRGSTAATAFGRSRRPAARTQRLLWASTSTKDPDYSDVKYVEALIGPDTINTMPLQTLHAYRDHGNPALRLEQKLDEARRTLAQLKGVGIDIDEVTQQLEDEGIEKFNKPFDKLMETLKQRCTEALAERPDRQSFSLGDAQSAVDARLAKLSTDNFCARLWRKDATLWQTNPDAQQTIRNGLGWLHSAETMESHARSLMNFARRVRADGFKHVVHMGMGRQQPRTAHV